MTHFIYGCGIFTIIFSLTSVIAARRFRFHRFPKPSPPSETSPRTAVPKDVFGASSETPPVSVLKPIKGTDQDMYRNLASFLNQDYPDFQILFCLQNPEDPALSVLKKLREDFPAADMEIILSKNRIGYNPKVNNLSNAYPFVKHDLILISDSDIRVGNDFLRRAVLPFADPGVGLVTCFYRSLRARGLGGLLEALSVNAQFLPQGLVAGFMLGLRFAMGATMLVRRQAFEKCGGFAALGEHLADDFILGASVQNAGYRVEFSDVLVDSVPGFSSFTEHLTHLARWSRTIRVCRPLGFAGLISIQGTALLTLHMLFLGPRASAVGLWLAVVVVRIASVGWIHLAYLSNPDILIQLPLIPLSDLIQFAAWITAFRSRTVFWRGETYQITVEGRLIPKKQKAPVPLGAPKTASGQLPRGEVVYPPPQHWADTPRPVSPGDVSGGAGL